MRLALITVALMAASPVFSETLSEAVQQSLIANPAAIFTAKDNSINTLTLKLEEPKAVNNLALEVVQLYLKVLFHEKRVRLARENLRIHRSIFLDKLPPNPEGRRTQQQIALELEQAEANLLEEQTQYHLFKKKYAKVVGKWPNHLSWPVEPAGQALPASVGEAIAQGLDGLYDLMHQPPNLGPFQWQDRQKQALIKKRSMIDLSKSIRAAWEDWTGAGLQLKIARKELQEAKSACKTDFEAPMSLLKSRQNLYQKRLSVNKSEYQELMARYRILDSVGNLLPFINTPLAPEESAQDLAFLTELDSVTSVYPDYKPQFIDTTLNLAPRNNAALWYVSAGTFKNKANAIALVNRLKGLGFMAFLKGSSVLIGPYDYPRHASVGLARLKDIAHVQGILMGNMVS